MSHKEHCLPGIWTYAPSATWKVKKALDQAPCCGGMPGWKARSAPASHTFVTGPWDRQRDKAWPGSPYLFLVPQNHGSSVDCCKELSIKYNLAASQAKGTKMLKANLGTVLWPIVSTARLAGKALSRTHLWLSTVMLCRRYKLKQRIHPHEDYCEPLF